MGSKASRRPFPNRLKEIIRREMMIAGKTTWLGYCKSTFCPLDNITPMDGSGAWTVNGKVQVLGRDLEEGR